MNEPGYNIFNETPEQTILWLQAENARLQLALAKAERRAKDAAAYNVGSIRTATSHIAAARGAAFEEAARHIEKTYIRTSRSALDKLANEVRALGKVEAVERDGEP